ncbi:hypothetical protein RN001_007721 [Aquatica leii]|uniref:cGMP-dependent protein kinase n=1 Tax=Aquatica leii TaxID=1421715 RepID=A0AAN7Q4J2_9COLE|nr:hypothetical protein RN001_007721 [Aquatica leii]
MGNANSIDIPGGGTEGYHVLKVQENSPGSKAGLEAFFDFIIAINGTRFDQDNETLRQVLNNSIGKQVPMTVYSSKTQSVRSVHIVPNENWGGQGLLGVSIRFCSFEGANENVWHVLEVHPSSPAEIAGLRSFTDYIIGADSVLHENEDLFALIEAHEARSLKLYVYNSTDDYCREVTITPHRDWGGEGSLGCGIGYGYLHRIPIRSPTTIKSSHPQTHYNNPLKSGASPILSNLSTTTNTINPVSAPLITPQPVPQYSVPTQMYPNLTTSNLQLTPTSNIPPHSSAIINNPVTTTNFVSPAYTNPNMEPIQSTYSQTSTVNTVYTTPSVAPPTNMPSASTYFAAPPMSHPNLYTTMPPLNTQMNQTTLIFDPNIAAQSAQQLLSNSNTPVKTNMFSCWFNKSGSYNVTTSIGSSKPEKIYNGTTEPVPDQNEELPDAVPKTSGRSSDNDQETFNIRRRSGLAGQGANIDKEDFSTKEIEKHSKDKLSENLIKEAISKNEFLNQVLEGKRLQAVVDAMYPREVAADEIIINEGSVGTQLYISASGSYEITIEGKSIFKFEDNRVFGELAILYKAKRQATIQALTKGSIWVLDQNVYQKLTLKTEIEHRDELLAFLEKVPKLNTVSKQVLSRVTDLLKREFYRTGEVIVRQGDHGDKFYIISAGNVTVTKESEGEKAKMGRGEFFGQLALLNDDVRQATVTADPPGVECFSLSRAEFILHFGKVEDIQNVSDEDKRMSTGAVVNPYQDVELIDLKIVATLGIGGFGRVELVQHKEKKEFVFALKYLKKVDLIQQEQQGHALNEKNIQTSCNSPFIVHMYKTMKDSKYLYFLMEACLGGDLWSLLQKQSRRRFDENAARFYAASVLEALAYLHERDIVYRDLKPENLLLDPKGNLKLTDFGFAKKLGSRGRTYTFAGTPEYIAPEIVLNRGHDKAVDYWALGILIFELLVGRTPFRSNDSSYMKTYNLILRGIENVRFPDTLPRKAEHLIKRLCRTMPTERLGCQRESAQAIRDHRWFTGLDWEQLRSGNLKTPFKRTVKNKTDPQHFDTFPKDTDIPPDEVSGWDASF